MTKKRTYTSKEVSITIEFPKNLEVIEGCPCDDSIIVCLKDHLLVHLQRGSMMQDAALAEPLSAPTP